MKKRKPTYLSFVLGKETYSVPTTKVLEVLEPQHITPIPNSIDFVLGVISFRGNIIPVISILQKLNLKKANINNCNENNEYVIIIFDAVLNQKKAVIAAIANSVEDVIAADNNEILPVPETGIKFNTEFLTGMLKQNETFIMIINIDKVLDFGNFNKT